MMSKAVAITLPYFEVQVSFPVTPSSRVMPGVASTGWYQVLVEVHVRPTRTAPPASGQITRVHTRQPIRRR